MSNNSYCAFVCFQVLLEAQEMAVKNHNVEYKSNLYVGKCAALIVSQCKKNKKKEKFQKMLDLKNVWTKKKASNNFASHKVNQNKIGFIKGCLCLSSEINLTHSAGILTLQTVSLSVKIIRGI